MVNCNYEQMNLKLINSCIAVFGSRPVIWAVYKEEHANLMLAIKARDERAVAYYGKRMDAAHKCLIAMEESEEEYPFEEFLNGDKQS